MTHIRTKVESAKCDSHDWTIGPFINQTTTLFLVCLYIQLNSSFQFPRCRRINSIKQVEVLHSLSARDVDHNLKHISRATLLRKGFYWYNESVHVHRSYMTLPRARKREQTSCNTNKNELTYETNKASVEKSVSRAVFYVITRDRFYE